MAKHEFGGQWTEEKLRIVRGYLHAYTIIFRGNDTARQFLRTIYIDAFAGSGSREEREDEDKIGSVSLFDLLAEDEFTPVARTPQTFKGSAQIALETEPSFDRYVFIEKKKEYADELLRLCLQYPERPNVIVKNNEAKTELLEICNNTIWREWRALAFLDPYGMQVDWETICAIGNTKSIDLWLLWPIGLAINRMMPRDKLPEQPWAKALDAAFGTNEWQQRFYDVKPKPKPVYATLFDGQFDTPEPDRGLEYERTVNIEGIKDFWLERLAIVFPHVAQNPKWLRDRNGKPMYLLCFASHNPTGHKIANDLLKK